MTDDGYKTLRVPEDDWERAREQKQAEDRTWGEQIVRPDEDAADLQVELTDVLDRLEELERTLPEKTAEELQERFQ